MELSSTDSTNYLNYTVSGYAEPLNNDSSSSSYSSAELNLPYAVCEILVAVCAVLGNGLVIIVFSKDRKLRRRTNYYIISLATADLLVGLFAIPFAILASIGLPTNLYACLFTVSVLVVLCTISIFCLVAVSIDRYWAILHPMGYSRNVRTKTAIGIICVCWIAGTLVGFLPLLGWNAGKKSDEKCIFVEVMDYDYLVFLYFATIIFPALLIAAFYAHIYRVVVKQLQQIVTMNPGRKSENQTTGTMLRLLGAAQKRDVKATQNLSRIVAFFIVCWFPLYTINCVKAFCPDCEVNQVLLNSCIILSHLNSVGNPLLYAYHLKDFRAALKSFIYKLLFPSSNSEANKAKALSVVSEHRGSIQGSQRINPRQNPGVGNSRTPRTSLLRRATDNAAAGSPGRTRMDSHIPSRTGSPELPYEISPASTPSDRKEYDPFFSNNVSPNSSELRHNDESLSTNNRSDYETPSPNTPIKVIQASIELRTYKPFVQFERVLNEFRETPESIFVIEADVNQTIGSLTESLTTLTIETTTTEEETRVETTADG